MRQLALETFTQARNALEMQKSFDAQKDLWNAQNLNRQLRPVVHASGEQPTGAGL